ncbi:hypothetical protein B0H13DRAFT_2369751 [Mycena leptocephala]|nr:hypothetical protein B0H13DRAFT_2369751 [Mycena leptocephala]
MPVMQGSRLDTDTLDELFAGVGRILDQESWQVRGESVCACGQPAFFHCGDCSLPDLCRKCMVDAHANVLFHDLREWSDRVNYYTHANLRDMGLRIAFGHAGTVCPHPRPARLEAISVRGIKTVSVDFCTCPDADSDSDQIKAHGWWPLRSNFVSALPLMVLNAFFALDVEALAADNVPDSDGESGSESDEGTESSTSEMSFSKMRPGGSRDTALEVDANDRVIEPRRARVRRRNVTAIYDPPSSIVQPPHPASRGGDWIAPPGSDLKRSRRATRPATPEASGSGTSTQPIAVSSSPPQPILVSSSSPPAEVMAPRMPPRIQSAPRIPPRIQAAAWFGLRTRREPQPTTENLWLTDGRPPARDPIDEHHVCGICQEVKTHPVTYKCGHSHCYVCIRVALEKRWDCPECRTTMHEAPFRQWFEEATLAAAYPGWGTSTSVNYSWIGLQFPAAVPHP